MNLTHRKSLRIFPSGLCLVLTFCLVGCGGGGSSPTTKASAANAGDIFNGQEPYGGPAPADAQVVSVDEFAQTAQGEGFDWDSVTKEAQSKAASEKQYQDDLAEIQRQAKQDPAINALLPRLLAEPPPGDPTVTQDNGGYLVQIKLNDGNTLTVRTMGKANRLREFLEDQKRATDKNYELNVYSAIYTGLPDDIKTGLPTIDSLQSEDFNSIIQALSLIENRLSASGFLDSSEQQPLDTNTQKQAFSMHTMSSLLVDPGLKPQGYIDNPDQEEHSGNGTDRSGDAAIHSPPPDKPGGSKAHSALGLFNNFWWPLKYYETSVKCQGQRGSCSAFAITSAIEGVVAERRNRWVNLSEQDVYFNEKRNEPGTADGANLVDWATYLSDHQYSPPYEDEWDYNPAIDRTDSDSGYRHSCDNYTEACSNTPGEGRHVCTTYNGSTYCGWAPQPGVTASGWKAGGVYQLWPDGPSGASPVAPVNIMRYLLARGDSMVLQISTCNGFENAPSNGFMSTDCSADFGGHSIHVVGFLSNQTIGENPSYNPPSGAQGFGGGYFIVKNSWGTGYGDGGYVYVPASWIASDAVWDVTVYPAGVAKLSGNTPPYLTITAPANNTNITADLVTAVKLSATAVDPHDKLGCCTVEWTSDKDGVLGSGFDIVHDFGFSPGTRIITATATDTNGTTFSTSITLNIQSPPVSVTITNPTPNQTFYTNVDYVLQGHATESLFPVDCSKLTWTSTASEGPWSGCTPKVNFANVGSRTLTLTATLGQGATEQAQVTINVINPPLSGAPVVSIVNPKDNTIYGPNTDVLLMYSMNDPGGTPNSTYRVVWKIKAGNGSEQVITPSTTTVLGFPVDYFIPSDYVPFECGGSTATLSLYVTDPEGLTGSQTIKIIVGYPPC